LSPILLDSDGLGEIGNKNKDKVDCVKSAFEIIDKLTEIENDEDLINEKDSKEIKE
jgi:hypothetical protein